MSDLSRKRVELNAVFEGGGVRGIGLVGALHRMEERGFTFPRVAGTSAGAIVAALYAAGYTAADLRTILTDADFGRFLSQRGLRTLRLLTSFGMHSTQKLHDWIYGLLAEKHVRTFADLKDTELTIIAADVTRHRFVQFTKPSHPAFEIADAVCMSASIPLFFAPRNVGEQLVVDGGLLSNYPLWVFDGSMTPTVGFKLVASAGSSYSARPTTLFSFARSLVRTMLAAHDAKQVDNRYSASTIHIPTGDVGTTDFHLSNGQREALYRAGRDAASSFLDENEDRLRGGRPPGFMGQPEARFAKALAEVFQGFRNAKDHQSVLTLGAPLSRMLWLENMRDLRVDLGTMIEEAAGVLGDTEAQAQALIDDIGWTLVSQHRTDRGQQHIQHGISVAQGNKHWYWAAKGLRHLGGIALQRGELEQAIQHLEEASVLAPSISDPRKASEMLAGIRYGQAEALIRTGQLDLAEAKVVEAQAHYDSLRDRSRAVKLIAQRASILERRGCLAAARDEFRRGRNAAMALGRLDEMIRNSEGLARVEHGLGNGAVAQSLRDETAALKQELPLPF